MATMTAPITETKHIPGGSFLITDPTAADCFFPEDFTDEHKQIAETTATFATNEIMPASDQIEAKDPSATVAQNISKQASFSVAFSAHTGIGPLPLVWYGAPEQKRKYLPKIASGE